MLDGTVHDLLAYHIPHEWHQSNNIDLLLFCPRRLWWATLTPWSSQGLKARRTRRNSQSYPSTTRGHFKNGSRHDPLTHTRKKAICCTAGDICPHVPVMSLVYYRGPDQAGGREGGGSCVSGNAHNRSCGNIVHTAEDPSGDGQGYPDMSLSHHSTPNANELCFLGRQVISIHRTIFPVFIFEESFDLVLSPSVLHDSIPVPLWFILERCSPGVTNCFCCPKDVFVFSGIARS